ncbi:MAG: hypothetical protein QM278_09870 [Pseudomonadota bacterium]|nr:hypothetical protein [Pseudomonadota bacterium]
MAVILDPIHDLAEILPNLPNGILAPFLFSFDPQREELRIGGNDLIQCPIFDFEDDQASILGVEDEIGLTPLYIRLIPNDVPIIRLGAGLEKTIERSFAGCCENLNIIGDHCRHEFAAPTYRCRVKPVGIDFSSNPPNQRSKMASAFSSDTVMPSGSVVSQILFYQGLDMWVVQDKPMSGDIRQGPVGKLGPNAINTGKISPYLSLAFHVLYKIGK